MRIVLVIALLLFVVAGAVFGALNAAPVGVDLLFIHVTVPLGAALLAAALLAWLLGGILLWITVVMPLRRELRRSRRQLPSPRPATEDGPASP